MDGYGWTARGDKKPEEKRVPFNRPTLKQALVLAPILLRYIIWYIRKWWDGSAVFIDIFRLMKHYPYYGVPCGGIGCGGIGRDFRGAFCKFSLRPGLVEQHVTNVKANQFILAVRRDGRTVYQKALTAADCKRKPLESWDCGFPKKDLRYRGLYPRSWTEYSIDSLGLTLLCEQISPVMPDDYQDTCLPTAAFVWTIDNRSDNAYDIALTFTFRDGTGDANQKVRILGSETFGSADTKCAGVMLKQTIAGLDCTYALATSNQVHDLFDPESNGADIWMELKQNGHLSNASNTNEVTKGNGLGIALCSTKTVAANQTANVDFVLVWHMPLVQFGGHMRTYKRRYTRQFGTAYDAAAAIAAYALQSYGTWQRKIDEWQAPTLTNGDYPDWYKSALFNELYFLTDGGSVWVEYDAIWRSDSPQMSDYAAECFKEYGRFAYIESWEYYMMNTYDVHFYSSFALLMNWPKLQHSLQIDFSDQVLKSGPASNKVKKIGRLPHDMGHPAEDPWIKTNAYMLHDTDEWKDLNLKYVLTTYRDFVHITSTDIEYLRYSYPAVQRIMRDALDSWDTDGDGMIENGNNHGCPDQTYDLWTMQGTSAYCGGLWLAALQSSKRMAEVLQRTEDAEFYDNTLKKARKAYVAKLWTGDYFRFDEHSASRDSMMADQLCGHWYLQATDRSDAEQVLQRPMVDATLCTLYKNNVLKFANGNMGPVNGMNINGTVDKTCMQADEVWTGVGYALAAALLQQGKHKEGFHTAEGIYNSCWMRSGLQYQTPEAIYRRKYYRAIGYMRPLSVWAMAWALRSYK